jgi:hypothetical protein
MSSILFRQREQHQHVLRFTSLGGTYSYPLTRNGLFFFKTSQTMLVLTYRRDLNLGRQSCLLFILSALDRTTIPPTYSSPASSTLTTTPPSVATADADAAASQKKEARNSEMLYALNPRVASEFLFLLKKQKEGTVVIPSSSSSSRPPMNIIVRKSAQKFMVELLFTKGDKEIAVRLSGFDIFALINIFETAIPFLYQWDLHFQKLV